MDINLTMSRLNYELMDFVEGVGGAKTARQAGDRFLHFAQDAGAIVTHVFLGAEESSFRATTLPDWVVKAEGTKDVARHSHVPQAVRAGVPMFFWGADIDRSNPKATPEGKHIGLERLRLFGQRNAVSFALPNKHGAFCGAGAGLGFEEDERLFRVRMDEISGVLSVATYTAHCRMQQLIVQEHIASPLSKRQGEILQLLAAGYQLGGIADKLSISDSTVNLHLSQLKKKLRVRTKEQALAKALTNNWIEV
ncbi:response regulator transcription factor [Shimia sp. R9_2]|uniref:helix-turn-helix transcriptional regulator n=1 Tax=Shimia sp. R9_2 TaxID=2821112 RepID=UPI001ADC7928|nr:LuxR C-terminal-related transcriptional regulator [Shimia sp. R9_2]MBO9399139.1 response regulator transcription factor [Shimia sp. R9_2]